ncbi:MAG: amidohydrolase family protein [Gammaproteobacteria bacterium]
MPNRKMIDAHMHLWDVDAHHYPWLSGNAELGKNYLLQDYLTESTRYRFEKAVHIQAGIDRQHSVLETAWLAKIAREADFPLAIVGYVDLSQSDCERVIEQHLAYPQFVGVRQILCDEMDYLSMPAWKENLSLLENYNLVFDAQIRPEQADALCEVLSKHQNTFVVEHLGLPKHFDHEHFVYWQHQMKKMAQFEHVFVKLSGFGMVDPGWTAESVKPFVATALELFGVERCLFGSNFPVEKVHKNLDQVYDGYITLCALLALSDSEQASLFYVNASSIYF